MIELGPKLVCKAFKNWLQGISTAACCAHGKLTNIAVTWAMCADSKGG